MTEENCDMMMMVVVPTQLLNLRKELSLWLLFSFSYLEVQQSYLQFFQRRPLCCLNTG